MSLKTYFILPCIYPCTSCTYIIKEHQIVLKYPLSTQKKHNGPFQNTKPKYLIYHLTVVVTECSVRDTISVQRPLVILKLETDYH